MREVYIDITWDEYVKLCKILPLADRNTNEFLEREGVKNVYVDVSPSSRILFSVSSKK